MLTIYQKGDLIASTDGRLVGFISDVKEGEYLNEYKIDFTISKREQDLTKVWKSEWWKESTIKARVISKKWIVQKKQ